MNGIFQKLLGAVEAQTEIEDCGEPLDEFDLRIVADLGDDPSDLELKRVLTLLGSMHEAICAEREQATELTAEFAERQLMYTALGEMLENGIRRRIGVFGGAFSLRGGFRITERSQCARCSSLEACRQDPEDDWAVYEGTEDDRYTVKAIGENTFQGFAALLAEIEAEILATEPSEPDCCVEPGETVIGQIDDSPEGIFLKRLVTLDNDLTDRTRISGGMINLGPMTIIGFGGHAPGDELDPEERARLTCKKELLTAVRMLALFDRFPQMISNGGGGVSVNADWLVAVG